MENVTSNLFLIFAIMGSFLFIFGTILNGIILLTLAKNRSLWTRSNILSFNICLSNFIVSVTATPLNVVANAKERWPFGKGGCNAYGFLATLGGLSCINHLAGAAFERYDAIDREANGRSCLNKRRVVYLSICIWFYSLCFSIAPLAGWSSYSREGIGTSCCVNWSSRTPSNISYVVALYLGCFVLPMAIIVYSYYKLFKAVNKMKKHAVTSVLALSAQKIQVKIGMQIFFVVCSFFISWSPYAVVALMSVAGMGEKIGETVESVPEYLAKSSYIQIPIIMSISSRKLRSKVLALLTIKGNQNQDLDEVE